jgi:hypothetical protein
MLASARGEDLRALRSWRRAAARRRGWPWEHDLVAGVELAGGVRSLRAIVFVDQLAERSAVGE